MRLFRLVLLAVVVGCGSSPPPVNRPRLKPDVRVLDEVALAKVVAFDQATGALELDPSLTVAPREVLVGGLSTATPHGLLRRVKSVAGTHVETEPASLEDVIAEGRIEVHQSVATSDSPTLTPLVEGVGALTKDVSKSLPGGIIVGLNDVVVGDADGDPKTKDDQVRLTASISMQPSVDLVVDVSLADGFKEVSAALSVKDEVTARITGSGGVTIKSDVTVATITWPPIVLDVGIPLVLTPELALKLGADGHAGVALKTEAVASTTARAGFGYLKGQGFGPIGEATNSSSTTALSIAGDVTLKVFAGPTLNLRLYGVAGPFMTIRGYVGLQTEAAPLPATCTWRLDVGAEVLGGVDLSGISVFGYGLDSYGGQLADFSSTLLSGACDPSAAGLNPAGLALARAYEGAKTLQALDAVPLGDGSVLTLAADPDGAWLARVRPDGSLGWQRFIPGAFTPHRAVLSNGRILLAGNFGGVTPWLARIDLEGNLVWSHLYQPSGAARGLVALDDGSAIVGGDYLDAADSKFRTWLMRVDAAGAVQWSAGYDNGQELKELRRLGDGVVMLSWTSTGSEAASVLTRVDGAGNVVWNRRATGAGAYLGGLDVDASGVIGAGGGTSTGATFARVGADGALLNAVVVNDLAQPSLEHRFLQVRAAPGGFVTVGRVGSSDSADALALQLSDALVPVWAARFGGAREDALSAIAVNADTGLWLLGDSFSFDADKRHLLLLRTTAAGSVTPSGAVTRHVFTGNINPPGATVGTVTLSPLTWEAPAGQRLPRTSSFVPAEQDEQPAALPADWTVHPL
ncbi:MAG: hypothetical protein AB1730_14285 [Myxococcota bacterium]